VQLVILMLSMMLLSECVEERAKIQTPQYIEVDGEKMKQPAAENETSQETQPQRMVYMDHA